MNTLNIILTYQNNLVIQQFCQEYPDKTVEQAQQIFHDLLAWLWLSEHRNQKQLKSHMIAPLHILDKMWHVFILHTRSYTDFCQQYFQRYLHHEVEHHGSEHLMSAEELTEYLNDAYEYLGEAWLLRNFQY